MADTVLINRVAESGIITINLEEWYPSDEIVTFDLKKYLFHKLILKEKEFRQALSEQDWTVFQDKIVLIQCTADAIIPLWAYMLVANYLSGIASDVYQGAEEEYLKAHYKKIIESLDTRQYEGQRIVIKGCSHKPVPAQAYATMTIKLKPMAQSIMFGEPCSTVPIFKRPKSV